MSKTEICIQEAIPLLEAVVGDGTTFATASSLLNDENIFSLKWPGPIHQHNNCVLAHECKVWKEGDRKYNMQP